MSEDSIVVGDTTYVVRHEDNATEGEKAVVRHILLQFAEPKLFIKDGVVRLAEAKV